MHQATGQLRERGEPDPRILDRLHRLNPRFKCHWMPVWHDGRPCWCIADHVGSEVYRATGVYRVSRLSKEQPGALAMIYGAILMADGGHIVRLVDPEEFGTDQMFLDLERGEETLAELADAVAAANRRVERRSVEEEIDRNPTLKALADDIDNSAGDLFRYYILQQHSVTQAQPARTGATA